MYASLADDVVDLYKYKYQHPLLGIIITLWKFLHCNINTHLNIETNDS